MGGVGVEVSGLKTRTEGDGVVGVGSGGDVDINRGILKVLVEDRSDKG